MSSTEPTFSQVVVFEGLNRDEPLQTITMEPDQRIQIRFDERGQFSLFYYDYSVVLWNAKITRMSEKEVEVTGFRSRQMGGRGGFTPISVVLTRPGTGWDI